MKRKTAFFFLLLLGFALTTSSRWQSELNGCEVERYELQQPDETNTFLYHSVHYRHVLRNGTFQMCFSQWYCFFFSFFLSEGKEEAYSSRLASVIVFFECSCVRFMATETQSNERFLHEMFEKVFFFICFNFSRKAMKLH